MPLFPDLTTKITSKLPLKIKLVGPGNMDKFFAQVSLG